MSHFDKKPTAKLQRSLKESVALEIPSTSFCRYFYELSEKKLLPQVLKSIIKICSALEKNIFCDSPLRNKAI